MHWDHVPRIPRSWVFFTSATAVVWEQPILQCFADSDIQWPYEPKKRIWQSFQLGWRDKALLLQSDPKRILSKAAATTSSISSALLGDSWGSINTSLLPLSHVDGFFPCRATTHTIKHLDWECIISTADMDISNPHISHCPRGDTADATQPEIWRPFSLSCERKPKLRSKPFYAEGKRCWNQEAWTLMQTQQQCRDVWIAWHDHDAKEKGTKVAICPPRAADTQKR